MECLITIYGVFNYHICSWLECVRMLFLNLKLLFWFQLSLEEEVLLEIGHEMSYTVQKQ